MSSESDRAKLEAFMSALGNRVRGAGRIYLAGGATAVLRGWRSMTIDIDIKPDPEPPGLYEALAALKNELDINVELASPDLFIPAVPGWRAQPVHCAPWHDRVFPLRSVRAGIVQVAAPTRS